MEILDRFCSHFQQHLSGNLELLAKQFSLRLKIKNKIIKKCLTLWFPMYLPYGFQCTYLMVSNELTLWFPMYLPYGFQSTYLMVSNVLNRIILFLVRIISNPFPNFLHSEHNHPNLTQSI